MHVQSKYSLSSSVEISREVQTYEIEHEGAIYIPDQDDCMDHGSLSPGDSCGQQFSYAEMSLYGCDYSAEMQDSYVMGDEHTLQLFHYNKLIPNQRL